MTPDHETIEKMRALFARGLTVGVGTPDGPMCVQAACRVALGLPFGDALVPDCTIAGGWRYGIRLNDARWSSPEARARGMWPLAVAQMGSAGVVDGAAWRRYVVEQTIRQIVPEALEAAAKRLDARWPAHAVKMREAATRCRAEGTREAAQQASAAAAYASAAERDRILTLAVSIAVEAYRRGGSPGVAFLEAPDAR